MFFYYHTNYESIKQCFFFVFVVRKYLFIWVCVYLEHRTKTKIDSFIKGTGFCFRLFVTEWGKTTMSKMKNNIFPKEYQIHQRQTGGMNEQQNNTTEKVVHRCYYSRIYSGSKKCFRHFKFLIFFPLLYTSHYKE